MTFWQSFGIAFIPAIATAIIGGIISFLCAKSKNESEIKKIEIEQQNQFTAYKKQTIYSEKKKAIFESLDVIDLYLSWLNYDDNSITPFRERTTPHNITIRARKCFNNLCVTCENELLILLFEKILFDNDEHVLILYEQFRNVAREELGLSKVCFDKDRIFISQISTKDLEENI